MSARLRMASGVSASDLKELEAAIAKDHALIHLEQLRERRGRQEQILVGLRAASKPKSSSIASAEAEVRKLEREIALTLLKAAPSETPNLSTSVAGGVEQKPEEVLQGDLVSVGEAAAIAGVHASRIYSLVRRGKIASVAGDGEKTSRPGPAPAVFVSREVLEEYFSRNMEDRFQRLDRTRQKMKLRASDGSPEDLGPLAFKLFDGGVSPVKVVIDLSADPFEVEEIYGAWLRMRSAHRARVKEEGQS